MAKIFAHTDDDGDEISFFSDERSPLSVEVKPVNEQSYIGYLDRDAALRLHAALGEWLYPVHTPEGPNHSLIEQMIERAVKDQVAAVLPLHLKPVATVRCDGTACCSPHPMDPEPHDIGHAEEPTGVHRPQDCPGSAECPEAEPEPNHGRLMSELPRRTRPRPICVSCEHGWGEHTGGICWGEHGGNGCTCTRERPGTAGTS